MQQEAELHADEDRKKRESIELKNTADSMAYQAEKTLRDNADKIAPELKTEVEARVKDVRDAVAADDNSRIESATDALNMAMQKIGEAVYGAQAAASAEGAPEGGNFDASQGPKGEGTVEGEFREV